MNAANEGETCRKDCQSAMTRVRTSVDHMKKAYLWVQEEDELLQEAFVS